MPSPSTGPHPKTIAMIAAGTVAVVGIAWGCWRWHQASRADAIVHDSLAAITAVEHGVGAGRRAVDGAARWLVRGEREAHLGVVGSVAGGIPGLREAVDRGAKAGSAEDIRMALEPGYAPDARPVPIDAAKAAAGRCDGVIEACRRRGELRETAVRNEMILKTALMHPIADALELPDRLVGVAAAAPDLLGRVPRIGPATDAAFAVIDEPRLRNALGMRLAQAMRIAAGIRSIASEERVRATADGFAVTARTAFLAVEPANDDTHWYRTAADDGRYDDAAYAALIARQRVPLAHLEAGDLAIAALGAYDAEVRSQRLTRVSENRRTAVTFRHTRLVEREVEEEYRDKDGNLRVRTRTKQVREPYRTDGFEFAAIIATTTPDGTTEERRKVGEKDSDDYPLSFVNRSWETWDYAPDVRAGRLISWKRYGTDNAGTVTGGVYDPKIHIVWPDKR